MHPELPLAFGAGRDELAQAGIPPIGRWEGSRAKIKPVDGEQWPWSHSGLGFGVAGLTQYYWGLLLLQHK